MLNPVRHGATPEDVARYMVEPYVVAADVYGVPPHTGRGGCTWYTPTRHRSAIYHIVVENAAGTGRGVRGVTVDAQAVPDGEIPLMDDGQIHEVRVELG